MVELVALHLRFYGYGRGEWTDSAVRRYVTDAGPLLPRLHKLTRSDCTTRNRRKAAAAGGRLRRARGADRPDRGRGGPGPGPPRPRRQRDHGAARACRRARSSARPGGYLKELRLDRGPLDHDEAEAELLRWAREQGHIA